jgi:hypothetical protein
MARQFLPVFWGPDDINDLKRRLRASAIGTDLGAQACAALPDTTRAAWGIFYAGVLDYCNSPTGFFTTGAQANRGEELENELYAWQQKLTAASCTLGAPSVNPQPAEPPGTGALKFLALAVIAVAGAYVVHEAVATIREIEPAP